MKRLPVVLCIWLLSLLALAAVVAFAFVHLDVPLALRFWHAAPFLSRLSVTFGAVILLSGESAVILSIVLARLVRGHIPVFAQTLAIACLTSICAYGLNDQVLKVFFGVPNPQAVVHGARHSFNLWTGAQNSGFPSGHMVLAAAFAGVFMRLRKASIWPLSMLLLLAAVLLLVGDWHFLSDLIAGTFLGLSAGMLAGEVWAAHSLRSAR